MLEGPRKGCDEVKPRQCNDLKRIVCVELLIQRQMHALEQDPDAYAELMGWLPKASKGDRTQEQRIIVKTGVLPTSIHARHKHTHSLRQEHAVSAEAIRRIHMHSRPAVGSMGCLKATVTSRLKVCDEVAEMHGSGHG